MDMLSNLNHANVHVQQGLERFFQLLYKFHLKIDEIDQELEIAIYKTPFQIIHDETNLLI